jgi:hypothetical protein
MDPSRIRRLPSQDVPENSVKNAIPLAEGRSSIWRREAGGRRKQEERGLRFAVFGLWFTASSLKLGTPVLTSRAAIVRKRRFAIDLRTQSRHYW